MKKDKISEGLRKQHNDWREYYKTLKDKLCPSTREDYPIKTLALFAINRVGEADWAIKEIIKRLG